MCQDSMKKEVCIRGKPLKDIVWTGAFTGLACRTMVIQGVAPSFVHRSPNMNSAGFDAEMTCDLISSNIYKT